MLRNAKSIIIKCYEYLSKNEVLNLIIYPILIILLVSRIRMANYNSISSILMIILVVYLIRIILFDIIFWVLKNKKIKRFEASALSFGIIIFSLLGLGFYYFIFFKIFTLFLVYGIYDFVKEKYLVQSMGYSKSFSYEKSVFRKVWKIDEVCRLLLVVVFLMSYYNIPNVFSEKSALYYFYSTTAQVFASLLGIIVMFGILILQDEKEPKRNEFLKNGLIGFAILFILTIIISMNGILFGNDIIPNTIDKIPWKNSVDNLSNFISIFSFEFILLMIPIAFLYLYAMIYDFLYWDLTINASGSIHFNEKTIEEYKKESKGATKTKVVIKNVK